MLSLGSAGDLVDVSLWGGGAGPGELCHSCYVTRVWLAMMFNIMGTMSTSLGVSTSWRRV